MMQLVIRYNDLEIRILEKQTEGYPVEFTLDNMREFSGGFLNPAFLPWVPQASDSESIKYLSQWFFADTQVRSAWAEIRGLCPHRRIRLRIDSAASELHAVPWELLRDLDVEHDLASSIDTPFSRYLAGRWHPGSVILRRPIKILVAIANPDDLENYQLPAFEIAQETKLLHEILDPLTGVELDELTPPWNLLSLETRLQKGYHILHLIAHGRYDPQNDKSILYLADEANKVELVNAKDFAEIFARQLARPNVQLENKLRLVFLDSCQTATHSSTSAFRAVASALVASGMPAVIAMQDQIEIKTAQKFNQVFYQQLPEHGQVDLACNAARAAILTSRLPGAATPVLYMRLRSGQLLGQRGQIFGEQSDSFWQALIENIVQKECTPFLGPRVTSDQFPSPDELAKRLAEEYNYPFPDQQNLLPKVAQFVSITDEYLSRRIFLRFLAEHFKTQMGLKYDKKLDDHKGLCEIIESINWSERSQAILESEIHHQLAEFGLPLYLTTNFDNLMTLALQACGHRPRRETILWRQTFSQDMTSPNNSFDRAISDSDPVVLHLFGTEDDLQSLVLTEDDHLDYLVHLSKDWKYLVPTEVQAALASTTLLFLGYRLEDLDFRVILRGLLANVHMEGLARLRVAVQIEADHIDREKEREVIRYFRKYLAQSKIEIYWGSTHQFMTDLYARWQEYHLG